MYVDNDPLVLTDARALLASSPQGATAYIDVDLYDPARILGEAAQTLDFGKPVALMLMGILGHVESDDEARSIIERLMSVFPAGSYVAMYDGGDTDPDVVEATRIWNVSANPKYHLRSPVRLAALLSGLEMVDPGVASVTRWKPDAEAPAQPEIAQFAAVALRRSVRMCDGDDDIVEFADGVHVQPGGVRGRG
ncbi:SAM-dependent methyltransferase [Actinoplanes sp. TBRC 11911]|uniref:SAM-dependent methyltransferase n=1 Tax=Actinoplanes sp. TBRC 11911 TaxID=2729386 RepID=UPI0028A07CA3|nr:SAM-dependent methyltransferase [Actinoplanes sp. TBRC 11911]